MHFLKSANMPQLIARLSSISTVYVPYTLDDKQYFMSSWMEKKSEEESFSFNPFRTALPFLKALFSQPKCLVAQYFSESAAVETFERRQIIFGVKACDLLGKKVLDTVFLKGEERLRFKYVTCKRWLSF